MSGLGNNKIIVSTQESQNSGLFIEKRLYRRNWRRITRQLVRCYGGIFCCKRPQKLEYKGLELRMEKKNNEGLGPGLIRGESTFLVTERNRAEVTATGNHEKPWKYKRAVDVWCTRSQEREKQTGQWLHQRSRLKTVESFQIGMSEVRLHLSRQVCYSNRDET